MCGVAGVVAEAANQALEQERVRRMVVSLHHRGPDGRGQWDDGRCFLGHTRLAVVDVSERSAQPMAADGGRLVLTYNGELYNFRELRQKLETKGHQFRSTGDTEVVLKWWQEHGPEGLGDLDGIFAFAVWDGRARELWLVRDEFGVKPLHYVHARAEASDRDSGARLIFASEVCALAAAGLNTVFDEATLDELLLFRATAGARTPYRNIRRVRPGTALRFDERGLHERRFAPIGGPRARGRAQAQDFQIAFDRTVEAQRVVDDGVGVGVLLSGGLDSSAVAAALAQSTSASVPAFHMGFDAPEDDETPAATLVAEHLGLDLTTTSVPDDEVVDLFRTATRLLSEPIAHGNDAYLHLLSIAAQGRVKVLMSGEGADEMLAGYVRYRPLLAGAGLRAFTTLAGRSVLDLALPVLARIGQRTGALDDIDRTRLDKMRRWFDLDDASTMAWLSSTLVLPSELEAWLGRHPDADAFAERRGLFASVQKRADHPFDQALRFDRACFLTSVLDRCDRMTMGASIECRVPFLGREAAATAASFSRWALFDANGGKRPLRQAMQGRLPPEVLAKSKWGFSAPWARIFAHDEQARSLLDEVEHDGLSFHPQLSASRLAPAFSAYREGRPSALALVRQLFFLKLWQEEALDDLRQTSRRAQRELRGISA